MHQKMSKTKHKHFTWMPACRPYYDMIKTMEHKNICVYQKTYVHTCNDRSFCGSCVCMLALCEALWGFSMISFTSDMSSRICKLNISHDNASDASSNHECMCRPSIEFSRKWCSLKTEEEAESVRGVTQTRAGAESVLRRIHRLRWFRTLVAGQYGGRKCERGHSKRRRRPKVWEGSLKPEPGPSRFWGESTDSAEIAP